MVVDATNEYLYVALTAKSASNVQESGILRTNLNRVTVGPTTYDPLAITSTDSTFSKHVMSGNAYDLNVNPQVLTWVNGGVVVGLGTETYPVASRTTGSNSYANYLYAFIETTAGTNDGFEVYYINMQRSMTVNVLDGYRNASAPNTVFFTIFDSQTNELRIS